MVPLLRPNISCALLCCESNLDASSYHLSMASGILSSAKTFCKIPPLSPSMKYSISDLSSVILDRPARILNWETYSSAESFPCRSCLSFALASPSTSLAENAVLSLATKLL